ncbi:MAG: hypothetical protein P8X48_12595 [Acidiferrobacteraceae bacterium]
MAEAVARFGGPAPEEIDRRLRDAAVADADRAEALLLEARDLDPACLPVYFALYKHYFYRSRLAEAEQITLTALEAAARQGGFAPDWRNLEVDTAPWSGASGPIRFFLFSLKALAFIRLRRGAPDEAAAILAKLGEIDPLDQVGATVIRDIAAGVSTGHEVAP